MARRKPDPHDERADRRSDARRRRALRRQDADRRDDLLDERAEQAFSRADQRARRGPHHRRLLVGLGRRRRGQALRFRHRLRHRRLGARAGELLRALGHPPDARARRQFARACRLRPSFDTAGYFADDPKIFARVAPVFLGEDKQCASSSRGSSRADDAFERLLSEREAEALKPAEAKVEARLGPAKRVTVAPEGLRALVLDLPPPAGGRGVEGAWRLDRIAQSRHDARHARALRIRQDGQRRRTREQARGEPQGAARARRGDRRRPTAC